VDVGIPASEPDMELVDISYLGVYSGLYQRWSVWKLSLNLPV